jgi:hypothetical protein
VFVLLEFSSPSRRIFIGSHSLPPLWFAVSVLQFRAKPRVTTRILLNKWQRQLEKERYRKRKHEEERGRAEEDARRRDLEQYTREQERAHWGCAFFRHCWNEGLKLPTLRNCLECSDRYLEYRQETAIHRSVHERIGRIHPSEDRRQKIKIIDHPRKKQADFRWG